MASNSPNDDPPRAIRQARLLVIVSLIIFVVGNTAFALYLGEGVTVSLFNSCVIGTFLGSLLAQIALHSIWTVFSNDSFVRRAVSSIVAALLILLSVFGTQLLLVGYMTGLEFATVLLCLPIILLAVQSPLWLMRMVFGWQIAHGSQQPTDAKRERVTIASLLLATAAVAICFAGLRVSAFLIEISAAELGLSMIIAAGILCAASLVAVAPSLVATLRVRHVVIGLLTSSLIQFLVLVAFIGFMFLVNAILDRDLITIFAVAYLVFVVVHHTPLLIARRLGFRLQLRQTKRIEASDPFKDAQAARVKEASEASLDQIDGRT